MQLHTLGRIYLDNRLSGEQLGSGIAVGVAAGVGGWARPRPALLQLLLVRQPLPAGLVVQLLAVPQRGIAESS